MAKTVAIGYGVGMNPEDNTLDGLYVLDEENCVIPAPSRDAYDEFSNRDNPRRIVAQDELDKVWISTVFLCRDHRFIGRGPPLVFETMVFGGKDKRNSVEVERYATWADAFAGHHAIKAKWETKR